MCALDTLQILVTAKEFNDAKKFGPHAEFYFFPVRNMRCETDPIGPGHVSIRSLFFTFPFAQPEGLLPARNDPLSQGELDGVSLASSERPQWPRCRPAWACAHRDTFFFCLTLRCMGSSRVLKVSSQVKYRVLYFAVDSINFCRGRPAGRETRSKQSPPTATSEGQLSPFFSSGFLL